LADNYAEGFMTKSWEGGTGTLLKKKLANGAHSFEKIRKFRKTKGEIPHFFSRMTNLRYLCFFGFLTVRLTSSCPWH
jgi:hypothetical protein